MPTSRVAKVKTCQQGGRTQILIAFEDEYRIYRDTIAAAIRILCPRAEVETAGLDEIGERIARFDPHVVVCSRPNTVDQGGRLAWVQLPMNPTRPTKVCAGGRYSELTNPTLEVLLRVIEETERLVQTKGARVGC